MCEKEAVISGFDMHIYQLNLGGPNFGAREEINFRLVYVRPIKNAFRAIVNGQKFVHDFLIGVVRGGTAMVHQCAEKKSDGSCRFGLSFIQKKYAVCSQVEIA